MKDIPPNVWRKSLHEDDWNFLQIQNDEWPQCLCRELWREKIQGENNGAFPSALEFHPSANVMRRVGFIRKPGKDVIEMLKRERLGTYEKPDWTSYLSWRKKEIWKLLPQKSPQGKTFWISLDWHTLHRHWGDEVEYAGTHLPFPPIMDGDGETEIVPFRIPWGWRDDEIIVALTQWLKENRPKGEKGVIEICGKEIPWSDDRPRMDEPPKPPKAKSGAGSYIRQVKKILKALAAWRLIQYYKGNCIKAYSHPGADQYLGKTYSHDSEWTDARKAVQTALKRIPQIQWEAENFASTKVK